MSTDFDDYLRYKRPPGFQFEFPAGKKFVWAKQGDKEARTYAIAEVLDDSDPLNIVIRFRDEAKEQIVSKDDIEGVNPAKFDGVEDCASLGYLSQPAVLHNLKLRYDANCIYTHSGLFTVAINPYKLFPIYTDSVLKRYVNRRRNEVPPHVFSVADEAYRNLLNDKTSQSMLVTGESGAGKTENAKRIIQYLATVAGRSGAEGTLEKQLLQANPLLEALGNAKTLKNNNSSRFGKFIKITFDHAGYLSGASIVSYLLETSRVVSQGSNERTFHIFYQILKGASQEFRNELKLTRAEDYAFLNQSGCTEVHGVDDAKDFNATVYAMDTLGFSKDEQRMMFRVIAGILHLGNTKFVGDENAEIADDKDLRIAAEQWKVDVNALKQGLIAPRITISAREKVAKGMTPFQAGRSRDALCKSVYNRLFLWVVDKINQTLQVHNDQHFIGILDIAGFEIFKLNSFEQLCINYTNERLQQFFNNHMFTLEQEEYKREKIEWTFIDFGVDSQATIDLIAKRPRGILILLDEQSVFPKASDESFVEALNKTHGGRHPKFRKDALGSNVSFGIEHYAGKVDYDATAWLEKNKDPLQDDLQTCISNSEDKGIQNFFTTYTSTSIQKGASFMTVGLKYREQLDDLMNTLGKTYPHFIRCIIPNHKQVPGEIDDAIVLDQLACNGVLEGIRISRLGFPNRVLYADFLKRYYLLNTAVPKQAPDPKSATKKIIEKIAAEGVVSMEQIRFGVTKIFFRAGEMAKVEELRERIVGEMIIGVQALARGFVGRSVYALMKAKKEAADILQRAVRTWLEMRNDAWWVIYQKSRSPEYIRYFEREKLEREAKAKIAVIEEKQREVEEKKRELRAKIAEFEQQNTALRAEIDNARDEQALKRSDLEILQAELRDLHHSLEATEETLKDTEREIKSRQIELASVESQMLQTQTSISGVSVDQTKVESDIRNVAMNISKVKAELDKEEQNTAALQKQKTDLEHELDLRRGDFEVLSAKKAKETIESSKVQGEVMHLGVEKQRVVAENKAAEKKVQQLQTEVKDLQPKVDKANKERTELEAVGKKHEQTINSTTGILEVTRESHATAKKENQRIEEEIAVALEGVESTRKANKKLSDALKIAKDSTEEAETLIESIVNEASADRSAISKLETRVSELQRLIADGEHKVAQLTKEITSKNAECESLQGDLEILEKRLSDLQRSSKLTEAQLVELREQNSDLSSKLTQENKQKAKLEQRIEEIKAHRDEERKKREDADRNLQKTKAEGDKKRGELDTLRAERERLEKANEAFTKSVHSLELEMKGAQQQKSEIEKKVATTLEKRNDLREQKEIAEDEKEKLTSKSQKVQEQLAELTKKRSEGGDMSKAQKDKLDSVSKEIERVREENGKLTKENDALEKKLRSLESALRDSRERLRVTEDEMAEAKKDGGKTQVLIQTEQLKLAELEAQMQRLKDAERLSEGDRDALERKLSDEAQKQNELNRDISEIQEKSALLQDAAEKEKKISANCKKRLEELEDEREDILESQEAAEKEQLVQEKAAKLHAQKVALQLEIEDLQKAKLEDERVSLTMRHQLDSLRRDQKSLVLENGEHERGRKAVFMRLQHVNKQTLQVEGENSILEERLKAVERKVTKAARKTAASQVPAPRPQPVAEAKPVADEVESAEEGEQAENVASQPAPTAPTELADVAQQISADYRVEEKLREKRGELRQTENELKNQKRSIVHYEQRANVLQSELEHLNAAISDAQSANLRVQRYNDLLKGEVEEMHVEVEAAKNMVETVRALIAQREAEIAEVGQSKREDSGERDRAQTRMNELKREILRIKEDIAHEREQTEKYRSLAHRMNELIAKAEDNSDSPLALPEQERPESIRRQTARSVKLIKKLNEKLSNLLVEKAEQDKITWKLQDTHQQLTLTVQEAVVSREIVEKEVASLHKQVLELREFSRDRESEAERARVRAQELMHDIESTKDALAEMEDKSAALERYKLKNKRKAKELRLELDLASQAREELAQAKISLEMTHRELKRLLKDERDARQEMDRNAHRTVMELEKNRNELHVLKAVLANEEREMIQLSEQFKQTQHSLNKLSKRLAVEDESARLEAQVHIVREELESARKRTAQAKLEARAKDEEAAALLFDMRAIRYDINQLKLRRARMERAQNQVDEAMAMKRRIDDDDEFEGLEVY